MNKILNKYIFVCGLHKSGTSLFAQMLASHPDVSSFSNTGFPQNEGQFLQSVYPIAREYGGPGRFGFHKEMQLTESSKLLTKDNILKLTNEWHSYWDVSKHVFLEKSPPNILKSRFLQAVFPNSFFIFIVRHPIAVSYATLKWSKTSIPDLLDHWVTCHKIMYKDLKYLNNRFVISYEGFVDNPSSIFAKIHDWVGIKPVEVVVGSAKNKNNDYFEMWNHEYKKLSRGNCLSDRYDNLNKEVLRFGYNLFDCL